MPKLKHPETGRIVSVSEKGVEALKARGYTDPDAPVDPQAPQSPPNEPELAYPYEDGDVIVLGPDVFAAKDGSVLSWRGENYIPHAVSLEAAEEAARQALEQAAQDAAPQDETAPEAPQEPPAAPGEPQTAQEPPELDADATIGEIMAWVGDDPGRAKAAHDRESARPADDQRSSLLSKLAERLT